MRTDFRALNVSRLAWAALLVAGVVSAQPAPEVVTIPAGEFVFGSDAAEREAGYLADERAYGHRATRESGWYDHEAPRQTLHLPEFSVTVHPITNRQYNAFVTATGHPPPDVDRSTWEGYGLVHPYARTRRHAWRDGAPPAGREAHPVVLVSWHDARAFARWLSETTGQHWRLPSEPEWEKAMRGTDGRRYPWGDAFEAHRLNSHDAGPFDTVPVGTHPQGGSPFGVYDGAGQVFEWIARRRGDARAYVKGGSWDDRGCGVCRAAARHTRPVELKHILIGFRLVKQ